MCSIINDLIHIWFEWNSIADEVNSEHKNRCARESEKRKIKRIFISFAVVVTAKCSWVLNAVRVEWEMRWKSIRFMNWRLLLLWFGRFSRVRCTANNDDQLATINQPRARSAHPRNIHVFHFAVFHFWEKKEKTNIGLACVVFTLHTADTVTYDAKLRSNSRSALIIILMIIFHFLLLRWFFGAARCTKQRTYYFIACPMPQPYRHTCISNEEV